MLLTFAVIQLPLSNVSLCFNSYLHQLEYSWKTDGCSERVTCFTIYQLLIKQEAGAMFTSQDTW